MEGAMSYRSWQEYVASQRRRYRRARRAEKGRILDEGCVLFDVHRKSLVRAFARNAKRPRKRRGRKPGYGPEVLKHLKAIWLASGQPCSKHLTHSCVGFRWPRRFGHGMLGFW